MSEKDIIDAVTEAVEVAEDKAKDHPKKGAKRVHLKKATRASLYREGRSGIERKLIIENDDGIKSTKWEVFCGPLQIVAYGRYRDEGGWALLLRWWDRDAKEVEWLMPMRHLADTGNALVSELMDGGLEIKPGRKSREYLLDYLRSAETSERVLTVDRIGWQGAGQDQSYIFPDGQVTNQKNPERVIMQGTHRRSHAFNISGDCEEWKDRVAKLASGNSRLVFAISAAFASVWLRPMQDDGGGFHFRGDSSMGKSTALILASSVWGGGGVSGFTRSWKTTANALEIMASQSNDCLLPLDEISQADPKSLSDVIYMLANGFGKERQNKEGQLRDKSVWMVMLLSTGEMSIANKVAEVGQKASAGMDVRLVDIPADAGAGMKMLEDIHGYETPVAFVDDIKKAALEVYGTSGRAYLAEIIKDMDGCRENLKRARDAFQKEVVPEGADSQISRVAARFSLVAAVGEHVSALGLTGWSKGSAKFAALRCFTDWLAERGGITSGEFAEACRRLSVEIETYGDANFQAFRKESRSLRVMCRSGWVEHKEDEEGDAIGSVYYFNSTGMKRILTGMNFKSIIHQLLNAGVFVGGHETQKGQRIFVANPSTYIPIIGSAKRAYEVDLEVLEKQNTRPDV